ncbi:hypothetical protein D9619_001587 [Psilocybe cf. subviscida]|uniref:Glycoside hydrolase family 71 protein n=1 Tax=Psilocybe cf. subviscida TaxID=2480587 RepID=A0A8H5BG31_9AGAR|nr:hypothetical protein D9619_001587 [Psilocybe cf. subviscida]
MPEVSFSNTSGGSPKGEHNPIARALGYIRPPASPMKNSHWTKGPGHTPIRAGEDQEAVETEAAAAATRKYVFAHFMVGNTYPYKQADWLADIKLAASQDIDGFVLNFGREDWQRDRVKDCMTIAKTLPDSIPFKFFFSFDMSSIPGNTEADVQLFRNYMEPHWKNPRMFRHPRNNRVVFSTFAGENCTFGQGSTEYGWAYLKHELQRICGMTHFVPSFFINPTRYREICAMDGAFNWNGGWPLHLSASSPREEVVNARLDSDFAYIENLKTEDKTFMAAVSPWFFTHYGPNSWNKNWIYRGDDWLFVRRWEQLVSMRDSIDMVQIISWNDYGECHYIGPIKGAQPNSQAWVDGYPHIAWLHLNRYFMKAFQTGSYPAITKDQIFLWARPHPKGASAADSTPRPDNWELTDDTAWMVVFATADAIVEGYTTEDDKVTFNVKAGMTKLSFPLKPDGGMKATVIRNGVVVTECNPIAYRFESRPGVYNFNACVAMST